MFDQEQHVCRLAADVVLATQAYVHAEKACADVANPAAAFERSLLSLVAEVYAMEFESSQDRAMEGSRDRDMTPSGGPIYALAAEFIASLVQGPEEAAGAGESPVPTSVLLGREFNALNDALRVAGYLESFAASRPVLA
jgi:hypothetical protein